MGHDAGNRTGAKRWMSRQTLASRVDIFLSSAVSQPSSYSLSLPSRLQVFHSASTLTHIPRCYLSAKFSLLPVPLSILTPSLHNSSHHMLSCLPSNFYFYFMSGRTWGGEAALSPWRQCNSEDIQCSRFDEKLLLWSAIYCLL